MLMSYKNQSLTKSFYLRLLIGIVFSTLCIGTLWSVSGYQQLRSETEILKNQAVQKQMELQKERVHFVQHMIGSERRRLNERVNNLAYQRTLEGYSIIAGFHQHISRRFAPEQVAELLKDALREVRFSDGQGSFFILASDGTLLLYSADPALEGVRLQSLEELQKQKAGEGAGSFASTKDGEIYHLAWQDSDDGKGSGKVAYVKYFAPLDWLVGVAECIEDLTADLQESLVERIEEMRFEDDSYIFIGNYRGISQSYPAKGRDMFEIEDSNGLKIVQELIRLAREGGGYLRYVMPPLKGERPEPKISYVTAISEWNWYIGTGDFVADLDQELVAMLEERKAAVQNKMGVIITVLILLLLVGWYVSRRLGRQVSVSFEKFQEFFDRAATAAIPLDLDKQKFSEFHALAQSANKMVDDRQKAEIVLRAQELKFRTLFEHVSDYALVLQMCDKQMIIVDLSPSACDYHGYQRAELIGQPISVLDSEVKAILPDDPRILLLEQGETLSFEAMHRRKDGSMFPVETLIREVEIEGQTLLFSIERDLTERKKTEKQQAELEEQLRQKYKMEAVGLMAGGIAHNFNNSLAIVLGNLEMAQRKFADPERIRQYLENARTAVLRSRDLVNQIMTYSRKGVHDRHTVHLPLILDETLKLLRSTSPATIELSGSLALDDETMVISADPGRIQEALINLYTNAVHAIDEQGEIRISLRSVALTAQDIPARYECSPGRYARLSVRDNGCGIPAEVLEKIFDPFFTTKEVNIGTGMGLSTVQGIVEQHAGLIKVKSTPGEGTEFELYFPLTEKAEENSQAILSDPPHGTEKVLFVDDEAMLIDIAGQMLTDLGYEIVATTEGRQALEMIRKNPARFDLVITDQTMPGMTGKELSHEIMQINPQLPVILCTGYSSKISERDIGQDGIRAYCTKPLQLAELSVVIRQVLGHKTK